MRDGGAGIAYTDNYFYAFYLNIDGQVIPFASVYLNSLESQEVVNQVKQEIENYYCPLNMIIFSQLLENEELREFLFWTSPLYEFNVSSGGGSAASISISLRSSSGLLKNVCILR